MTAWLALGFYCAAFLFGIHVTVFDRRFGKGRILTRPLMRSLPAPIRGLTRILQIVALMATAWPFDITIYHFAVGAGWFALYGDDLLSGDDDRWKRWRKAVRNAVRWLMKLPRPAAAPEPC